MKFIPITSQLLKDIENKDIESVLEIITPEQLKELIGLKLVKIKDNFALISELGYQLVKFQESNEFNPLDFEGAK